MKTITAEEALAIDNNLKRLGYTVPMLTEIAGYAAFEVIDYLIQSKECKILILFGPKNNGADGLVIARWLHFAGHKIHIHGFVDKISKHNSDLVNICLNLGISLVENINQKYDFVIDAVFGYGFKGKLEEPYFTMLESIIDHPNIISIDVPSGYIVDEVNKNPLFKPKIIVSFVAPKICCNGYQCYVTRSFVPKCIFYEKELFSRVSYIKLN